MYTSAALIDMVERTHRSLAKLIAHVATLPADEWSMSRDGFGVATIPEQIEHQIGAQKYWLGVIEGRMDVDEDESDRESAAALECYRKEVQTLTENYLRSATVEELNTPRTMLTWGGKEQELTPAHIVLRTVDAHLSAPRAGRRDVSPRRSPDPAWSRLPAARLAITPAPLVGGNATPTAQNFSLSWRRSRSHLRSNDLANANLKTYTQPRQGLSRVRPPSKAQRSDVLELSVLADEPSGTIFAVSIPSIPPPVDHPSGRSENLGVVFGEGLAATPRTDLCES